MSEEPAVFACEPGTPFKWPKGTRLHAVADVTVMLPGALLQKGEAIEQVIDATDDALIGFDPAPNGNGFDTIRIKLNAGQAMTIKRSSMAVATASGAGSIHFYVLKS